MMRFVLTWLGLSVFAGAAVAQVTPAVQPKSKSLNFTFGGFGGFGLAGTGPAGGVGITYFKTANTALRFGLQVRSYSRTLSWNSAIAATGNNGSESGTNLGLSLDYLKYMRGGTSRVRPYFGGGVGVMAISNKSTPAVATGVTATETRDAPGGITAPGFASPGMTYDIHANLGAEFFLFNEISIAGEYGLNVINRTAPSDMQTITGGTTVTTKGNPSTMFLGLGALGATVRIYF